MLKGELTDVGQMCQTVTMGTLRPHPNTSMPQVLNITMKVEKVLMSETCACVRLINDSVVGVVLECIPLYFCPHFIG